VHLFFLIQAYFAQNQILHDASYSIGFTYTSTSLCIIPSQVVNKTAALNGSHQEARGAGGAVDDLAGKD
jgi:hypothetical protein